METTQNLEPKIVAVNKMIKKTKISDYEVKGGAEQQIEIAMLEAQLLPYGNLEKTVEAWSRVDAQRCEIEKTPGRLTCAKWNACHDNLVLIQSYIAFQGGPLFLHWYTVNNYHTGLNYLSRSGNALSKPAKYMQGKIVFEKSFLSHNKDAVWDKGMTWFDGFGQNELSVDPDAAPLGILLPNLASEYNYVAKQVANMKMEGVCSSIITPNKALLALHTARIRNALQMSSKSNNASVKIKDLIDSGNRRRHQFPRNYDFSKIDAGNTGFRFEVQRAIEMLQFDAALALYEDTGNTRKLIIKQIENFLAKIRRFSSGHNDNLILYAEAILGIQLSSLLLKESSKSAKELSRNFLEKQLDNVLKKNGNRVSVFSYLPAYGQDEETMRTLENKLRISFDETYSTDWYFDRGFFHEFLEKLLNGDLTNGESIIDQLNKLDSSICIQFIHKALIPHITDHSKIPLGAKEYYKTTIRDRLKVISPTAKKKTEQLLRETAIILYLLRDSKRSELVYRFLYNDNGAPALRRVIMKRDAVAKHVGCTTDQLRATTVWQRFEKTAEHEFGV